MFSRYPTNKWIKLGTFHGRDERNVQSFPLDEQMYAKYVKVMLINTGLSSVMKIHVLSCYSSFIPHHTCSEIRKIKRKFTAVYNLVKQFLLGYIIL